MIPLVEEVLCPSFEDLFSVLPLEGSIFLDSATQSHPQGKYSFIAFDPFYILNSHTLSGSPFLALKAELEKYSLTCHPDLPPFQGGAAGWFGYELGGYLEKLPQPKRDDLGFPKLLLGFYDLVIACDHHQHKTWLFSSGMPEQGEKQKIRAQKRMHWALQLLEKIKPLPPISSQIIPDDAITSTFTKKEYEQAVERVIEYIRAGDIFEANISQRFSGTLPAELTAFELYRRLRRCNPAPFSAFAQFDQYKIASASPERFLQLKNHRVETRPIKGTRKRNLNSPVEDKALAEALASSDKDRAENVMIVDLMRNDLSRVCLPHSVMVPALCQVESFATVHHLVSTVSGQLKPNLSVLDLLQATFPGGSITGAPKIRAMEIIAELEPTARGPYCGSIGYLGFNGDMDLSITIRTFAIRDNFVTFQTGGAVTVDSDPDDEFQETLAKAQGLFRALQNIPNAVQDAKHS
ncbi:MAG: aminodeoxychorismate synthase component I [Candidatus Berkiellales bacterium]